jgi:hypothetical protein
MLKASPDPSPPIALRGNIQLTRGDGARAFSSQQRQSYSGGRTVVSRSRISRGEDKSRYDEEEAHQQFLYTKEELEELEIS